MQTSWSRGGFALRVHVQDFEYSMMAAARRQVAGFLAVVTISLSHASVPAFPRLVLGDDGGDGFESKSEALRAGIAAANRMLDDLLG